MITNNSLTAKEIADDIQQTVDGCSEEYRRVIVDRIEKLIDEVISNCLFDKSLDKQIKVIVITDADSKGEIAKFYSSGMTSIELLGWLRYFEKKEWMRIIKSEEEMNKKLKKSEDEKV